MKAGKIGPHEGKEFQLFKAGKKHVILCSWDSWPEEHLTETKLLRAKALKFKDASYGKTSFIFYRSGYARLARELRDIINSGMSISDDDWEAKEFRIGEILGYTKEDVACFIEKLKKY